MTIVWVARGGGPLSEKGIDFMMRSRTKAQYGVAFGAHRFRAGLTTTQALVDGKNLLGTVAHPGPLTGGGAEAL